MTLQQNNFLNDFFIKEIEWFKQTIKNNLEILSTSTLFSPQIQISLLNILNQEENFLEAVQNEVENYNSMEQFLIDFNAKNPKKEMQELKNLENEIYTNCLKVAEQYAFEVIINVIVKSEYDSEHPNIKKSKDEFNKFKDSLIKHEDNLPKQLKLLEAFFEEKENDLIRNYFEVIYSQIHLDDKTIVDEILQIDKTLRDTLYEENNLKLHTGEIYLPLLAKFYDRFTNNSNDKHGEKINIVSIGCDGVPEQQFYPWIENYVKNNPNVQISIDLFDYFTIPEKTFFYSDNDWEFNEQDKSFKHKKHDIEVHLNRSFPLEEFGSKILAQEFAPFFTKSIIKKLELGEYVIISQHTGAAKVDQVLKNIQDDIYQQQPKLLEKFTLFGQGMTSVSDESFNMNILPYPEANGIYTLVFDNKTNRIDDKNIINHKISEALQYIINNIHQGKFPCPGEIFEYDSHEENTNQIKIRYDSNIDEVGPCISILLAFEDTVSGIENTSYEAGMPLDEINVAVAGASYEESGTE